MRSSRLGLATLVTFGILFWTLLLPLRTLVALRARLPTAAKSFPEIPPGFESSPRIAAAPLANRVDSHGQLCRAYFPGNTFVGSLEERARELLATRTAPLGIAANPPQLERVSIRRSPSGSHIRFGQTMHGIPIWGAEAVVSFDAKMAPRVLASDLATLPVALDAPESVLEPADACSLAVHAIGGAGGLHAPIQSRLFYRERAGGWRLEHRVGFTCESPPGDWEVWIDARTGSVREVEDRTVFAVAARDDRTASASVRDFVAATSIHGTGRVFLPDPCLTSGDPALQDGGDADAAVPEAAYAAVALRDLEPPLRGFYRLAGPWARLEDWDLPACAPDSSPNADFSRSRSAAGFEDVMVYYHLDAMQRWFRSLGFEDANARSQIADAHGMRGQDNSKYVPSLHKLSFGEGGVDDAEDAEVVVHEYAHATQFNIVPTWGTGGHAGALGEGFGDYLANSYAWGMQPERVEAWNGVFQWDGHNAAWPGRRAIDTSMHYPENASGEAHRAGTLWCSALTDALYTLRDRAILDRLVLDSMYSLTGAASMEDWANAILASDVTLYAGAHANVLVEVFGRWGLVDPRSWSPVAIEHTPVDILAAREGAPRLQARIVSSVAVIDSGSVLAHVRTRGDIWHEYALAGQGENTYSTTLSLPPSSDIDLEYYLEARDAQGNLSRLPAAAPAGWFSIAIGAEAARFETDSGWVAGLSDDDAFAGRWVRAAPVGTAAQPNTDHTFAGNSCFVTGNAAPGQPASDADVDGGKTTLLSPVYDLRGANGVQLSYWRWFSNDQGTSPDEDPWTVEASNDAGATWVTLEETRVSEARWRRLEFDLASRLGMPDRLRLRFVARDQNGGSLVEAAVDDVLLQVRTATEAAVEPGPVGFALLPNLPNPCNPTTELRFSLDRTGPVRLGVYDARGRSVRDPLLAATLAAGFHAVRWDGRDASGAPVASGIYFARLATDRGTLSRRITVLR